ncbi:hypothetical protein EJ05DRAFT_501060 [Pseudovirgaria hyperparasitica]|uniref:Myb-like domain-containing protein n=1 Tax=Pseudovirgaria hyperparasitica TaxID=470096 RepID=A0A6A6W5T5_9PEZI|nr:uncharacterized protein EJ05DRAFT_501060 [Pseudovirgaria hyperparasitica]KAF2757529.1 hypothetical protein EJ05DRAFT_501060 [Pseudovirgaria hyperparasitica]
MEPRINSLINPDLLDHRTNGQVPFQFTLPSIASQRPAPVEPSYNATDDLQSGHGQHFHGRELLYQQSDHHTGREDSSRFPTLQPRPGLGGTEGNDDSRSTSHPNKSSRSKHGVPIAEVLNGPDTTEPSARGGLDHILRDGALKRRRVDDSDTNGIAVERNTSSGSNGMLTLPRPHSIRKKASKRLPPLLQGLHQPPPDAGLFPRITEKDESTDRVVSAHAREEETRNSLPAPKLLPEKESRAPSPRQSAEEIESSEQQPKTTGKEKSKRNKWTDEETAHLLRGVARFGIGKWKKILECEDYEFKECRTSVDLKDRFRSCRPRDYSPQRIVDKPAAVAKDKAPKHVPKKQLNPRKATSLKDADALAEMGIEEPFAKSTRRTRRPFTESEDRAILEGYEKHGSLWHLILKSPEFDTRYRSPRDLRDRFRTKFSDLYVKSGLKSKAADGITAAEESSNAQADSVVATANRDSTSSQPQELVETSEPTPARVALPTNAGITTSTNSLRSLTLMTNFHDVYPSTAYEEESGDDYSPVTLNRNIFGWADANAPLPPLQSLSMSLAPESASFVPSSATTTNTSHGITMSMLMTNDSMPPPPAPTVQKSAQPDSVSGMRATSKPSNSQALPSLSSFLDFAPSVSGRSSMFNLPPPSDTLPGFDFDGRVDGSHTGLLWEDRDEL